MLAGMVIAIPAMGILKVISDHMQVLRPLGYTLGNEDISNDSAWAEKIKSWFSRKKK
jgi:hypothetical protein